MADAPRSTAAAAGQFLAALRNGDTDGALALLGGFPDLVRLSLHASAAVCDAEAVRGKLAVDPGSAIRRMAPNDFPPIVYAVQSALRRALGVSEAAQLDTIRQLLDAGADPNTAVPIPDSSAEIPILHFPCTENAPAVARVLLERGALPNDGESLYHAAQNDHRDCLDLLLEFGADPSGVHEPVGNTPLYFLATHTVDNPIVPSVLRGMRWLLEHGADPNVRSHRSASGAPLPAGAEPPLLRAAASGLGVGALEMLVAHGAEVNAARDDGRTAWVMAYRRGDDAAADWLAGAGAEPGPLQPIDRLLHACLQPDVAEARAIVDTHPDVIGTMPDDDRAALAHAVGANRADVLATMLAVGWPLDAQGEWGGTALHVAAWQGRVDMARALIAAGAPVNVRDTRYGSSPLAWAAHGSAFNAHDRPADYVAIASMLIDAGATPAETLNRWGESPASFAHPAVAQVLRQHGFTGNTSNSA